MPEEKTDIDRLRDYRDAVEGDIIEGEKSLHTIITYIAAGGLGFFLTLNEKFFNIRTANGELFFIGSIIALIAVMILHLVNTNIDIKANDTIRKLADDMIKEGKYDEPALTAAWKPVFKKSRWWTRFRFVILIVGIILEVIFIVCNYSTKPAEEKKKPEKMIRINVSAASDTNHIIVDSTDSELNISITH